MLKYIFLAFLIENSVNENFQKQTFQFRNLKKLNLKNAR